MDEGEILFEPDADFEWALMDDTKPKDDNEPGQFQGAEPSPTS